MKEQYHLVSFSGGKDSTAMLLGMLERDMKIDCILFCDTGLEFPAMYDHIAKVEKNIGRKITSVRAEHTYEELMFDVPVRRSADSPVVRQYGAQLNGSATVVYHTPQGDAARAFSAGTAETV